MKPLRLGNEELKLLRLIAENGATSVREASESYGNQSGVRLTTVGQMMERLRKKGYLRREGDVGSYRYCSNATADEINEGVVREFVETALEGSLSPFALYLTQRGAISPEELEELQRTLDQLKESHRG